MLPFPAITEASATLGRSISVTPGCTVSAPRDPAALRCSSPERACSLMSGTQALPGRIDENRCTHFDLDCAVAHRVGGADAFADPLRAARQQAEADPAFERR